MAEIGIAYTLIGPDGTRAVVGNGDAAYADPDFVGLLDGDNGITGLLDTADVRESPSDLVEGDGGIDGAAWLGRRSGTLQGILNPWLEMPGVNRAEARLKRAARALRADALLIWTPSGESGARMLRVRRQGRVAISGRRPKQFQVSLSSRDPYVLSADEQSVDIDPASIAGELGVSDPVTDPVTSELNVAAQTLVTNLGDAPTWPRLRIVGPMTNPTLLNNTTGESFRLNVTLTPTDILDIYPDRGGIVFNGGNAYSLLDFPASRWWQLQPGANDVRVLPVAYSAGALVTVRWRHAWE